MLSSLQTIDIIVVISLLVFLLVASMYSSFHKKDSEEYFMAGRSLKWYSVAGSIFGTNIHAQQIIGMMGIGYSIGFAQSHYEVLAVPAILMLAYIFIPIYRKREVFTLSQFLENRYSANARLAYTIIMITFIMIQLIAGFYIGSRTLGILFQGSGFEVSYLGGILIIAVITCLFTVVGGMESVVIADNILTILMIFSIILMGILMYSQPEIKGLPGLLTLDRSMTPDAQKMHLYLPSNHPKLPWGGIFTGLIILHFFYWTTNQYQVQRVLAAATDRDARLGTIAAGFLKLIIPFFSIAVGVAAYYLFKSRFGENVVKPDDTFLKVLETVVPGGYGFTGLILAGLTCAIFSAIYSMMNSVTTMLSFDVYRKYINPTATDRQTVGFGQVFVFFMCGLAAVLSFTTYDPTSSDNFFLKLADQISYLKPGLVVAFFGGVFWKKTHSKAAVIILWGLPLVGFGLDYLYNHHLTNIPFFRENFGEKLNFLYRVFAMTMVGSIVLVLLSHYFNGKGTPEKEHDLSVSMGGVWRAMGLFFLLQLPVLLLVFFKILTPQSASILGALATGVLFFKYLKEEKEQLPFWQSDIFYAGLLSTITVWILYFFA